MELLLCEDVSYPLSALNNGTKGVYENPRWLYIDAHQTNPSDKSMLILDGTEINSNYAPVC